VNRTKIRYKESNFCAVSVNTAASGAAPGNERAVRVLRAQEAIKIKRRKKYQTSKIINYYLYQGRKIE
jgi:hypothetical protein